MINSSSVIAYWLYSNAHSQNEAISNHFPACGLACCYLVYITRFNNVRVKWREFSNAIRPSSKLYNLTINRPSILTSFPATIETPEPTYHRYGNKQAPSMTAGRCSFRNKQLQSFQTGSFKSCSGWFFCLAAKASKRRKWMDNRSSQAESPSIDLTLDFPFT